MATDGRTIDRLARRPRPPPRRYRGINRNHLGLTHRVAALNLRRLINLGLDHNGRRWIIT